MRIPVDRRSTRHCRGARSRVRPNSPIRSSSRSPRSSRRRWPSTASPASPFGIVKNGQVTVRGFGVTNLDDPQPITADTIFALASISKTVTATAMMRLVEQGKVDLDAPVQKYLPGFKVQDEAATRDVKIWHLLTHTPGWEGQLTSEDRGAQTLAYFVESMKDLPKLRRPGEVWSYNNAGFIVAGRVIEVVSGQTIHNAFRTLVFEPIGLTRAFTRVEDLATYRVLGGAPRRSRAA